MSKFRSPLELRLVCPWANEGRGEWEFTAELRYYSDLLRREVVVPAGFRYDGASVPRLPLAFALFGGRYWRSAGLHDKECRDRKIPRTKADKLFLEAMRVENEEELNAMDEMGFDEDTIELRRGELEGQARTMYAAVAALTKSGTWKEAVDHPGFQPIG